MAATAVVAAVPAGFVTAVFVLAATPLLAGTLGDLVVVGVVFVTVGGLLVGVRVFFAAKVEDSFDAGLCNWTNRMRTKHKWKNR